MQPRTIVIYCGLLMSAAAFGTDVTLPAFPQMEADLSTSKTLVQWTIPAFLIAAGMGQVVWGGMSDRLGRKPALAGGLAMFLVGCLIAAFAESIELLLAARALQGFGGAAAIVSSRAIVRDLYTGEELARGLALATAIFAAGPIVAPLAGGIITEFWDWRVVFGVLAAYGAVMIMILVRMPETLSVKAPDATKLSTMKRRAKRMFDNPQSRYFLIMSAITSSAIYLIITSLPVIYDVQFQIDGFAFSVFFAVHGLGIIVGQIGNRRLIRKYGIIKAMILAGGVLLLTSLAVLAGALSDLMNAYSLSALMILFATSYLIVYSNGAALVLDPHGDIAGYAASVFGVVSQIGGSLIAAALVVFTGASIAGFGISLLGICLVSLAGTLWWQSGAKNRLRVTT